VREESDDPEKSASEEESEQNFAKDGHEEPEQDPREKDPYEAALSQTENEEVLSPEELSKLGDKRLDEGNLGDALEKYRGAVRIARETNTDESDHRTTLGDAYAYSGQSVNAYRQYKRAIKMSPRLAEPHFSLGELYHRYGRLPHAISEYQQAIAYAPENAWYRYKISDALAQFGQIDEAIIQLEETTKLKPQDAFYHFWLGDMYARAGRSDEALIEMQQATMFSPYDAYYNIRLATLYRKMERIRDAALAVRQALRIVPDSSVYHCLLADYYNDLNLGEWAVKHYEKAGVLDDYDTEQLSRLRRYSGEQRVDEETLMLEAMDAYNQAMRDDDTDTAE
jgi:tetratricopeptide (TPR) repeat protein